MAGVTRGLLGWWRERNRRLRHYKKNRPAFFVFPLSSLYIIIRLLMHDGAKESIGDFFLLPALISPAILILFSKNGYLINLLLSFIFIATLAVSIDLYWDYMDKPWFPPLETFACDGRCYGWFSFENEAPTGAAILVGLASVSIGSLIKFASSLMRATRAVFVRVVPPPANRPQRR